MEFSKGRQVEYDNVRGNGLGNAEEERDTFTDAVLRC